MKDCLVCFAPIKKPWKLQTTCPCQPSIHKACWDDWVAVSGAPICIICREVSTSASVSFVANGGTQMQRQLHSNYSRIILFFCGLLQIFLIFYVIDLKQRQSVHDEL